MATEAKTLSETEIDAWLRLNALEFGPKRAHALLTAYESDPAAIFAAGPDDWQDRCPTIGLKYVERLKAIQRQDLSKERAAMEKAGAHLVTRDDPRYPSNLRQLPDAPPVLLVRGALVPEDKFSVAIVGSRRATQYGLSLAKRFAHELAAQGLSVVSGGARGVDTSAHRGALEAQGRTIVFLGCGVETPCKESPARAANTPGRNTTSAPPFRQMTRSTTVPSRSRFRAPSSPSDVSASRTSAIA
jgi:DNA processing protein